MVQGMGLALSKDGREKRSARKRFQITLGLLQVNHERLRSYKKKLADLEERVAKNKADSKLTTTTLQASHWTEAIRSTGAEIDRLEILLLQDALIAGPVWEALAHSTIESLTTDTSKQSDHSWGHRKLPTNTASLMR